MSTEMNLSYYCYLVVEKNKLNTARHRQYNRINKYKYDANKPVNYLGEQVRLLRDIQDKIKECKSIMSKARRVSGYSPCYNGGNYIKRLRKDDHWIDEHQIKRLHDDYLAEAIIFGIIVENPYHMDIL